VGSADRKKSFTPHSNNHFEGFQPLEGLNITHHPIPITQYQKRAIFAKTLTMKYLDPKNDLVFKKVFGEHPDILKSILNSMLPLTAGQEIVELEYLSAEMIPETFLEKFTSVDVR
jgi:hypothetical protein